MILKGNSWKLRNLYVCVFVEVACNVMRGILVHMGKSKYAKFSSYLSVGILFDHNRWHLVFLGSP